MWVSCFGEYPKLTLVRPPSRSARRPTRAGTCEGKEPEPQFFRFEGVWLTETGMAVLRNLTMSPLHKRRQRRGRLGLPGEAGLEGSEPSDALGPDDKKDGDLDTDDLLKGEGWAGESQRKADSGRNSP